MEAGSAEMEGSSDTDMLELQVQGPVVTLEVTSAGEESLCCSALSLRCPFRWRVVASRVLHGLTVLRCHCRLERHRRRNGGSG